MTLKLSLKSLALAAISTVTLLSGTMGNTNFAYASNASNTTNDTKAQVSTVAKPEKIVFGYLPNEETVDDNGKKGREILVEAMTKEFGMPVEVVILSDYNAVIEAMRNNKVQIASFGPFSYIIANERSNAEAMVVTAKSEKDAVYKSYLIAKADSNIKTLNDIKGKSMSFVDPASTSGNLVPRYMVIKGLNVKPEEVDSVFSSVTFSGNHLNSLQAVLNGSVEVAAVASSTYESGIKKGIFKEGDLVIVAESKEIPSSPIAVNGRLPKDLKDKIVNFFNKYDNKEYFTLRNSEGKKFIPVKDEMYNEIREIAKLLNLSPEELLNQ